MVTHGKVLLICDDKAYSDYGNNQARSYSNILYKRKSDQERLKQQME